MWELEFSREAGNYILDSGIYADSVLQAIETLIHTKDGIPREGCTHLDFNHYLWEVAGHLVLYTRLSGDRKLYITVIKPI
jgi:hypothetical protein